MVNELSFILQEENEALKELLALLDEQFKLIMGKDIFKLDAVVNKIQLANKKVAEIEVSRRNIVGNEKMKDIINFTNSKELDRRFRELKKTIEEVRLQKDTNEMLIKQELGFTNRMLNMLTPKKEAKTYSSYGSIRR